MSGRTPDPRTRLHREKVEPVKIDRSRAVRVLRNAAYVKIAGASATLPGYFIRGASMHTLPIVLPAEQIERFCRKWMVREFSLFGSVLRDDFRLDSDVDVLVSFQPGHPWSLFDLLDMQDELSAMFHRPVDLVTKGGLRNPFRRHEILTTRRVIYAA